jgi:hypothetical protein
MPLWGGDRRAGTLPGETERSIEAMRVPARCLEIAFYRPLRSVEGGVPKSCVFSFKEVVLPSRAPPKREREERKQC